MADTAMRIVIDAATDGAASGIKKVSGAVDTLKRLRGRENVA